MTADLVTIATTAALTQFVGPTFKQLGEQALERAKQLGKMATTLLQAAGTEPQPVSPKILIPLLESASLEDDDFLHRTWANLLANAANPSAKARVDVGFVDIMKQLSPLHILILSDILSLVDAGEVLCISDSSTIATSHVRAAVGSEYSTSDFDIAVDNLVRLRLCAVTGQKSLDELVAERAHGNKGLTISGAMMLVASGKANIEITNLGKAFIQACMPPQAVAQ